MARHRCRSTLKRCAIIANIERPFGHMPELWHFSTYVANLHAKKEWSLPFWYITLAKCLSNRIRPWESASSRFTTSLFLPNVVRLTATHFSRHESKDLSIPPTLLFSSFQNTRAPEAFSGMSGHDMVESSFTLYRSLSHPAFHSRSNGRLYGASSNPPSESDGASSLPA